MHVALLRGINVAGKNKLPMTGLAALFEEAGCREVRTYIASGNVVYRAGTAVARRVPEAVAGAILERFRLRVSVLTRTAAEIAAVARGNPFLPEGADPASLHVMFLAGTPAATAVAELDPGRSPPDTFRVLGREVYLHCPHGFGRTKLTNDYFDAKLSTTSTVRNWRTVLTLAEMAEDGSRQ